VRRRELAEDMFAVCVLEVAVRRTITVHSENRKERAPVENREQRCAGLSGQCRQVIYCMYLSGNADQLSPAPECLRALGGWQEEVPWS
jgi:hypothetical protein